MQANSQPNFAHIDFSSGNIAEEVEVTERDLSDMQGFYQDQRAVDNLLPTDPLMYRVYMTQQSGDPNGLYTATSIIEPGQIGREYYMTKGHFHYGWSAVISEVFHIQFAPEQLMPGQFKFANG